VPGEAFGVNRLEVLFLVSSNILHSKPADSGLRDLWFLNFSAVWCSVSYPMGSLNGKVIA
jgi:hypothetical protein